MKNILILALFTLLVSCGGDSSSNEDVSKTDAVAEWGNTTWDNSTWN